MKNQPLTIEIVNPFPDELAKRFYEIFGNKINCKINRSTFADFILWYLNHIVIFLIYITNLHVDFFENSRMSSAVWSISAYMGVIVG